MSTSVALIGGLAIVTAAIKAAGPIVLGGRELPAQLLGVISLLAPALDGEDYFKDLDFSADGIRFRREAGLADARRMIARAPWEAPVDPMEGVIVHELSARTGG